ncbi:hypothetical protein PGIGA_G00137500 [Pangasianodon gigas]|uniref:Uncharacterized protein n=1 Tax=Pangasianodon gigas TaxID=30993 RepID=A0ACC5XKR9_PANGG|nr:hypothetical protein [Pangasianodon gigas]
MTPLNTLQCSLHRCFAIRSLQRKDRHKDLRFQSPPSGAPHLSRRSLNRRDPSGFERLTGAKNLPPR